MFWGGFTQVNFYEYLYNGIIQINEVYMKTKIIKGIKIIFLIIVLFVTTVVVINTSPFDEELSPEIIKIIKEPSYPQVKDNAYFALMGFQAQKDKNIIEVGHQLIQRYIQNRSNNNDSLLDADYDEILGTKMTINSKVIELLATCDNKVSPNCLTELSQKFNESFVNDADLSVLLTRYRNITHMKHYHNYTDGGFGGPIPSFLPLMRVSQIHLVNNYKNQSNLEFINQLLIDMSFWKKMLGEGTLLIDKMVALNGIRIDLIYLSEFIRNQQIDAQVLSEINKILSPLSSQEMDLSEALISESKLMFDLREWIEKDLSFFERLLFQPNATSNYHYELNLKKQLEWSQKPLKQFIKDRNSKKEYESPSKLQIHYLYNFIGKYFIEVSGPYIDDYVARTYDINNIFKLVKIQLQVKLSETQSTEEILSKPDNSNPFDGQPFNYDQDNGTLKFECLDKFRKCEIKI